MSFYRELTDSANNIVDFIEQFSFDEKVASAAKKRIKERMMNEHRQAVYDETMANEGHARLVPEDDAESIRRAMATSIWDLDTPVNKVMDKDGNIIIQSGKPKYEGI